MGLGHSSQGILRDWYKLESGTESNTPTWTKLADFESHLENGNRITSEGRVAGTQGKINDCELGFVLSGDGDDHGWMKHGEFHLYDPESDTWMALPPHPGFSRWAPGSFVIGKRVFFTSGVDRKKRQVFNDLWEMDLTSFC